MTFSYKENTPGNNLTANCTDLTRIGTKKNLAKLSVQLAQISG